ncbi:MAG: glycosyltransferase, partial [Coriobacteriia bacterium]|nr:glycosyltransferase [Coriobacteriia bacterium]
MSKGLVNMPRACIALRGVLDWRTRKTAQALIAGGFDVTIVQFADPSIICDCRGLNVINVAPPFMGGSKVKWRPLRVALNLGPLRLAAALSQKKQGLFFNEIIYKSIINERPDIIHGINVDVLEACTMAAKKLGAYLIYEAYEYWPDHLTEEALYYSQEQRNHAARIEEICIGSVDRVITVSPVLAKAYQEHYKLTSCPEIVYNAPLTISQSAAQPSTPLRLLFLGNLQRERNVMTVLKAALRVPGVALTFQGSGDMKAELLSVIESNDAADRVFIREPVPLDEVTRSAQEHDVGIVAHQAYNVQMEG